MLSIRLRKRKNISGTHIRFFTCAGRAFFSIITVLRRGEVVPNRIEPPILLTRMMIFVLAASVVTLAALAFTLTQMFPLNRAEVFFLSSEKNSDVQIVLTEFPPEDKNFDIYKRMFIREYIKARNEVLPNVRAMSRKWNVSDGIVRTWSTDDVFTDFIQTNMWNNLMQTDTNFDFSCSVEFRDTGKTAIREYTSDHMTYLVDFAWFCKDSYGQTDLKNYTIKVRLAYDDGSAQKYSARLNNPLGIHVAEYSVMSDGPDPLNEPFAMVD